MKKAMKILLIILVVIVILIVVGKRILFSHLHVDIWKKSYEEWKLVKDCVNSREPSAQVCF